MTLQPLDFCYFTHPYTKEKTFGQIKTIGTLYYIDNKKYKQVIIDTGKDTVEIKSEMKPPSNYKRDQFLMADKMVFCDLELVDPDSYLEEEIEPFQKDVSYFVNIIPDKDINLPYYIDTPSKEKILKLLQPLKGDGLEDEEIYVRYLQRLQTIYSNIIYSYPMSLKPSDDLDYGNCDSKQGAYHCHRGYIADIIYQFKLANGCRINRKRGSKANDFIRIKLSEDRIEELRIAIVAQSQYIREDVCSDLAESKPVSEVEYVGWLTETKDILERVIKGY